MKKSVILLVICFLALSFSIVSASQLKVTSEHPFLVNNTWVKASDLKIGDILKTADGKNAVIKNITEVEERVEVYNLEASPYSDFVVSDGVIVHNSNDPYGGICFTGDTLITMANGEQKQIKDIGEGESVLSWNFETNETMASKVNGISRHLSSDIYLINGKIRVTAGHPFWTLEAGWSAIDNSEVEEHPELKLSELKIGNHMQDYSGNYILIESIVKENATEEVYNLADVGESHNYFADNVLVHNQGNPCAKYFEEPYDSSGTELKCKCGAKPIEVKPSVIKPSGSGFEVDMSIEAVTTYERGKFIEIGPKLADASYREMYPGDLVSVQLVAYKFARLMAKARLGGRRNYNILVDDVSHRAIEGLLASDYLITYRENAGSANYLTWIYGRLYNFVSHAEVEERVYIPVKYVNRQKVEGNMESLGTSIIGYDGNRNPVPLGSVMRVKNQEVGCELLLKDLTDFIDSRVMESWAVADPDAYSPIVASRSRDRKLLIWQLFKNSLLETEEVANKKIASRMGVTRATVSNYQLDLLKFIREDPAIQFELKGDVEVGYTPSINPAGYDYVPPAIDYSE